MTLASSFATESESSPAALLKAGLEDRSLYLDPKDIPMTSLDVLWTRLSPSWSFKYLSLFNLMFSSSSILA
jgi:hypothetical protein